MSQHEEIAAIERDLTHLLDDVLVNWSDEQIKHARSDIYNGEYGLAIELIAATLARRAKPITPEIVTRVVDLFQRMALTDNEYLAEFRNYATSLGIGLSVPPQATDDPSSF